MDRRARLLKLASMIFMVFTMILIPVQTKAYWSTNLTSNHSTHLSTLVTIGSWNQVFSWSSTITYLRGNRVTYNGVTYEAKKENSNVIPGVSSGWKSVWRQV